MIGDVFWVSLSGVPQPQSAWEAFEEQIKMADDTSGFTYGKRRINQMPTSGSDTFHRVMKQVAVKSQRGRNRNLCDPRGAMVTEVIDDIEDDDDEYGESSAVTKMAASRGWMLIRRTLEDISKERKNADASFNWSFLRQHLFHMSDMQRARQELYERYIFKPNTWADGLIDYPYHFFKKPKRVMDWRGQIITLPTNPRHVAMAMKRSQSDVTGCRVAKAREKSTRNTVSAAH